MGTIFFVFVFVFPELLDFYLFVCLCVLYLITIFFNGCMDSNCFL